MLADATAAQPAKLFDGADGATCEYFNHGARIKWRNRLGDWADAKGTPQGGQPYAEVGILATDRNRVVHWDVSHLVQRELAAGSRLVGMVIMAHGRGPAGIAVLHSREAAEVARRPSLVVTLADGSSRRLPAVADATLDCTTVYSIGTRNALSAGNDRRVVVQFDLGLAAASPVKIAVLEMVTTDRQFGDTKLGAFKLEAPVLNAPTAATMPSGIATRYPRDAEIGRDAAVVMATGFESAFWWKDWNYLGIHSNSERIDAMPGLGFDALDGHALMVKIPAGKNLGLDIAYKLADKQGREPEEIYFRYYLRLASDWNPTTSGGKLPGISATYGRAGWGGRKTDGFSGWSMRGSFYSLPVAGSPFRELTPIGTYAYHADMKDFWGDPWAWTHDGQALLERNRWYCIEQYMKVNQVGQKDAVFRAWVDGRLVFEQSGFRVRDTPSINIEQVWMNVYYGGTAPSPSDQHLFIDNVVIARRYIGPIAR